LLITQTPLYYALNAGNASIKVPKNAEKTPLFIAVFS